MLSGLTKMMMMTKINAGNSVKMGESNVYAVLGSTKKGPTEFAKMAAVKDAGNSSDSTVPMKNVVNMPADSYFQGYMNYLETGENLAQTFSDFSVDRFNEIMEYLKFDKDMKIEKMSAVALQKIKIAATLSRNSRVYMLECPFKGMNATAREEMFRVIFSWAAAVNTIAILCNSTDEVEQMITYTSEHQGDLPVISIALGKSMNESYA